MSGQFPFLPYFLRIFGQNYLPAAALRRRTGARRVGASRVALRCVAHERISSAAILSPSSVKTNSSSIGLPGKLPVSRLVTMVLPSF